MIFSRFRVLNNKNLKLFFKSPPPAGASLVTAANYIVSSDDHASLRAKLNYRSCNSYTNADCGQLASALSMSTMSQIRSPCQLKCSFETPPEFRLLRELELDVVE